MTRFEQWHPKESRPSRKDRRLEARSLDAVIGGHRGGEVVVAVCVAIDAGIGPLEDQGVGIGFNHDKHPLLIKCLLNYST